VPVGTVRSRLNRARGKLRQQVGEIHPSLVPSVRMTGEPKRPGSEPCGPGRSRARVRLRRPQLPTASRGGRVDRHFLKPPRLR
jgi:hypothetical protein